MNYLNSLDQLEPNSKLYIYGSGSFAITITDQFEFHRQDIEILGYIDKFKTNGFLKSKPIINIDALSEIDDEIIIIVATDISYWREISEDLKGRNYFLNKFHDFNIYRREEMPYDIRQVKEYFKRTDQVELIFEAIESKNIDSLINNPNLIHGNDDFLKKLKLQSSHKIINGGGSNGNENDFFLKKIGEKGKIFSFDPNHQGTSKIEQLEINPYVLYDKDTKIGFEYNGSRSRIIEDYKDKDEVVDAICIDTLIHQQKINKIDCITLDVEGFEKKVLEGAEWCIKNHKPTLAISVYHSTADFFEIPIILKEFCSEYTFDIGIYSQQAMDTMLHATID